jgi:hypothetical protein
MGTGQSSFFSIFTKWQFCSSRFVIFPNTKPRPFKSKERSISKEIKRTEINRIFAFQIVAKTENSFMHGYIEIESN